MLVKLRNIWKKRELDIREIGKTNVRWLDQKVTPDVLSAICDAIVGVHDNGAQSFTVRELWDSEEFARNVQQDFGKPHPKNKNANLEYDKFVNQPVNTLALAGVLDILGGRPKTFSVSGGMDAVIGQMADSERKTVEFLDAYIYEVMSQSGMALRFDDFFNKQTDDSFCRLKGGFEEFVIGNTNIQGVTECRRMFPKALNVLAYCRQKKGTVRGRLSKHPIGLSDIRYNRLNVRDIIARKPKHIPRKQHKAEITGEVDANEHSPRAVQRVIRDVKRYHDRHPEIGDRYSAAAGERVEGHHIFPQAEHRDVAAFRENIILLTPAQHHGRAHTHGTFSVSKSYQLLCLMKKLDVVEMCEKDPNCDFYRFQDFKMMLFTVGVIGEKDAPNAGALAILSFDEVRRIITEHYTSGDESA